MKQTNALEWAAHGGRLQLVPAPALANADTLSDHGTALLAAGRLDEAHRAFMASAAARPLLGGGANLLESPRSQIRHHAEQLRYLAGRGSLPAGASAVLAIFERALENPVTAGDEYLTFDSRAPGFEAVAGAFDGRLRHLGNRQISGPAINPELDTAAVEARFLAAEPKVVYVDDILSSPALEALQSFCLESTVWRTAYRGGYVGAFLQQGFTCPALLAVAHELRLAFPRIFGPHRLTQAWAFKYDSQLEGIAVHADFAAVNVNLWITPNAANLEPDRGGLLVWDRPAPRDWSFADYNNNQARIRAFLNEGGAKSVRIPYRENRVAIFDSTLFHETDAFRFAPGYENRRLNMTFLYGQGLSTAL